MSRQCHNIAIILLLVLLAGISPNVSAQEDGTDSASSPVTNGNAGSITFEGSEDASLFVGYYRLNPGDTVQIEIITDTQRIYMSMIDDEGYIAIPVLGRVMVANLTANETRELLQGLADEYYRNAWVTCQVVLLGKVKFYVYGDVDEPGFYTASGATTFFDFLQKFDLASDPEHRRIVHVRGERGSALPEPVELLGGRSEPSSLLIDQSLDLFMSGKADEIDPSVTIADPMDFTLEGEIEQRNFYLEFGDVIYVPDPATLVMMEGFRRPGIYEVLPGEGWSDLFRMAGQPEITSDIANLVLERYGEDGQLSQVYYNLNYLEEEDLEKVPVINRDRLLAVPHEGNVYVLGEVNTAGSFPYSPGRTPLDYLTMAGGPTAFAHLRFAVIVRPPRDLSAPLEDSEIFEVDLINAVRAGAPAARVSMEPGDILFVPDKGETIDLVTVLSGLSVLVNAVRLFE